ncbi:2-oxoglutarate dehydrogenase E1 component [Bradyrhizobium sp. i1.4.4]
MNLPVSTSSAFFLDFYARYQRDPYSVPADWRVYFEGLNGNERSVGDLSQRLIEAYRLYGHLEAKLDPLGLNPPIRVDRLDRVRKEIEGLADRPVTLTVGVPRTMTMGRLASELVRIYSGSSALEASHVEDETARDWLYDLYEKAFTDSASADLASRALESIALADTFEDFIRIKFPSKKRFGVEGAESSIVFLRELLRNACLAGFGETTIGGMHRGRLATLATVLDKPVGVLLAEIKGRDLTNGGADFTGDVPYHLGYAGELIRGDRRMKVSISPHPSHLMTVAPVVTGLARAKRAGSVEDVLCLLLHTDAAFSGQGLTSEVLQLGGLVGYQVGGTIHLVVNNQIGFTTTVSEGRSSRYCTDIGKATGVPVIHVNGDDPLAVMRAAEVALAWRRHTSRDILIDVVCYRRNGHNELDEPSFTQPRVSAVIKGRPSLRQSFAAEIADEYPEALRRADIAAAEFRAAMQRGYEAIESLRPNDGPNRPTAWANIRRADAAELLLPVATGVAIEQLREIGAATCALPADIDAHPKVAQFYQKRLETILSGHGINFATAEALAFATLLAEGVPVRLSGQDTVRGTFTQRHLAVHDMQTDRRFLPLSAAAARGISFEPVNSPLSEYAVLGFEYGHSLADPHQLTIWEAQFGDFLNGAQIVADQFIVSAEAKWEMMSGLVVQLPHGLEGQGPDHSSARIERLLQLAAGSNIIIANPSTPANLFHLLRRQVVAPWRKPLFVIAPKSLLRQKNCASDLAEMGAGTGFRPVIAEEDKADCRRVILCSGKIFYDLMTMRAALGREKDVALVSIEQLHPFPMTELSAVLDRYQKAECVWCQEEPENQGAQSHVLELLRQDKRTDGRIVTTVSRPRLPVAAGGSIERHEIEQQQLVRRALEQSVEA